MTFLVNALVHNMDIDKLFKFCKLISSKRDLCLFPGQNLLPLPDTVLFRVDKIMAASAFAQKITTTLTDIYPVRPKELL